MYCQHCGQQIEENDTFCKHCGAQIGKGDENATLIKNSWYDRFQALPAKWQIVIIASIFWIFLWIGIIMYCGMNCSVQDYESALVCAFLFVVVFPFAIFSFFHIRKMYKQKKESKATDIIDNNAKTVEKPTDDIEITTPILEEKSNSRPVLFEEKKIETSPKVEVERYTLKDFAFLYGKMQVKVLKSEDFEDSYCVFTNNGKETRVDFDPDLGKLSAAEISARKLDLCIIEYAGKTYLLTHI